MEQRTFTVEHMQGGAGFDYKSKKFQKELQRYEWQRKVQKLDEQIQSNALIAQGRSQEYLLTVLSWLDGALDNIDPLQQLEYLGVLCERPRYLFSSVVQHKKEKKIWPQYPMTKKEEYKKFEKKMKAFYSSLDEYINELSICYRYMRRGTKEVNRPCDRIIGNLETKLGDLQNSVNDCYRSYFYIFQALGLKLKPNEPPILNDRNLAGNCVGNPYLWPISHVMLLRDMQYQLLGKVKYKKEELFFMNAKSLMKDYDWESEDQHKRYEYISYACMMDLKHALLQYVERFKGTNPWMMLTLRKFEESELTKRKLIQSMEKQQKNFYQFQIGLSNGLWQQRELFQSRNLQLCIPVYDCEYLALKLSRLYQLNDDARRKLTQTLPVFLSNQCKAANVVKDLDQSLPVERIEQTIESIRRLLNPAQHEKLENNQDDIKRAISHLEKEQWFTNLPPKSNKSARIQCAIASVAELKDLTNYALLLSSASDPCPDQYSLLPPFIKRQMKKFNKVCNTYRRPRCICALLGMEPDDVREADREKIEMTGIREKLYQFLFTEKLSWEQVRNFLEKYVIDVISYSPTQRIDPVEQRKKLKKDYTKLFEYVTWLECDKALQDAVLYEVFDCLLEHAFYQLRSQVLSRFYEYSRKYCGVMLTEKIVSKGGECLGLYIENSPPVEMKV